MLAFSLHYILLEKHCRCKQRNCWQTAFSVGLVGELAAKDIVEFQVMFRISTDSFDDPSR